MENNNDGSYLPIVPYVDVSGACLKNHARPKERGQSFDGCQQFTPRGDVNSYVCDACGCHRAFHQVILRESREEPQLLPLLDNLERGLNRPIRHSRIPPQPNVVRRKARTKVSPYEEIIMEYVTDIIGWNPRQQDKNEANKLCEDLNISRAYYLGWIRDMKMLRDTERQAARVEAERAARAAREADEAAAAAGSLLLLGNSSSD
uniref:ZF-HD dimerization-type domain-containing protein n=1 Tax=Kalanchoe fedtschenkoi TaxID=63787 RepID=A0A7N0RHN9_KALFE